MCMALESFDHDIFSRQLSRVEIGINKTVYDSRAVRPTLFYRF